VRLVLLDFHEAAVQRRQLAAPQTNLARLLPVCSPKSLENVIAGKKISSDIVERCRFGINTLDLPHYGKWIVLECVGQQLSTKSRLFQCAIGVHPNIIFHQIFYPPFQIKHI
jgi:hypothetical protein